MLGLLRRYGVYYVERGRQLAFSRSPRVRQNLHLFLLQFVEGSRLLMVLWKRDESRRWRFRKSGKDSSREQSDDHREKEPSRQNHKYVVEQLPSSVSVPVEASLGIVEAETGGGNVLEVLLRKNFCTHKPQQQGARRTQVRRSPLIKLTANRVWDYLRPSIADFAAKRGRRAKPLWLQAPVLLRFDRWPGMGRAPRVRPGEIAREKASGIGS
ncbi:MAG: hypothetical protein JWN92_3005 [Candidatus Acidoferrum typicum]|nr:hypothetical protein [Candidatus Acidoferrum typicum]